MQHNFFNTQGRVFLKRHLVWVVIVVLLAACGRRPGKLAPLNPTSMPDTLLSNRPVLVSLDQLQANLNMNPDEYLNQLLRVSGDYYRIPPPDCYPFSGPGTVWTLISGGLRLDASGFETEMQLVGQGTSMTVDGFLRLYDGPLGCGKEAPGSTFWYLQVVRIIQPNPLWLAERPAGTYVPFGIAPAIGSGAGAPLPGEASTPGGIGITPLATLLPGAAPTGTPQIVPTATSGGTLTVTPTPTGSATGGPPATNGVPTTTPSPTPSVTPFPGPTNPPGSTQQPLPTIPPEPSSTPAGYPVPTGYPS